MIKTFLFLGLGFFGGVWIAWPGIVVKENWTCAKEIALKSKQDRTDLRTLMAISPKFLLERQTSGPLSNIRIIGDACFR